MEIGGPIGALWRRAGSLSWLLLSLPALLLILQVKQQRLTDGGFRVLARNLQRLDEAHITLWERAALHLPDLLSVVLIWLALLLLFREGKHFVLASACLSTPLIVFLYVNLQVFGSVGRYVTPEMMADAWHWVRDDPQQMEAYVSPASLLKLAVLLLGNLCLHVIVWRMREQYRASARLKLLRLKTACLVTIGGLLLISHAKASTIIRSHYAKSTLRLTVSQLAVATPLQAFRHVPTLAELVRAPIAGDLTPGCGTTSSISGRARDHDVLIFSMETMPASVIDWKNRIQDYPAMSSLAANALVAQRHHTTFPYTSYALYSAFTGLYPTQRLETTYQTTGGGPSLPVELPGYLRALERAGYKVDAFFPTPHSFELDRFIYRSLGNVNQHIVKESAGEPLKPPPGMPPIVAKDLAALRALEATIQTRVANDQRYVAMFFPQIGHAPWRALDSDNKSIPERGRAIARLQDEWLASILATLEKAGRRDKTLIIVQADHGIRTRNEDPSLSGGTVDAYSFHVPLLIHSREVFGARNDIGHVTSHVDIASTIGDLLGVELQGETQGVPIHCPEPPQRVVPLFADWYLGADGLYANDEYCMVNNVTESVYCNQQLAFNESHIVLDDDKRKQVIGTLRTIKGYQQRYTELSVPRAPPKVSAGHMR